jgi:hypothetical protein
LHANGCRGLLEDSQGKWHQPHDVEEDVIAHDVWYPSLV